MAHELRNAKDDLSLGDLFSDLSRETSTLVRQEVLLAKTEIGQKLASVSKDIVLLAVGGVLAHAGVLALIGALIAGLTIVMPLWGAALLVCLVLAGVGGALAMQGVQALKRIDPVPHETVETLKEDAKWAKEQTR